MFILLGHLEEKSNGKSNIHVETMSWYKYSHIVTMHLSMSIKQPGFTQSCDAQIRYQKMTLAIRKFKCRGTDPFLVLRIGAFVVVVVALVVVVVDTVVDLTFCGAGLVSKVVSSEDFSCLSDWVVRPARELRGKVINGRVGAGVVFEEVDVNIVVMLQLNSLHLRLSMTVQLVSRSGHVRALDWIPVSQALSQTVQVDQGP